MIRVGLLLIVMVPGRTVLVARFAGVMAAGEFFTCTIIRSKQKGGCRDNGTRDYTPLVAGKCPEHRYLLGYSTSRTLSIWWSPLWYRVIAPGALARG